MKQCVLELSLNARQESEDVPGEPELCMSKGLPAARFATRVFSEASFLGGLTMHEWIIINLFYELPIILEETNRIGIIPSTNFKIFRGSLLIRYQIPSDK